MRKESTSCSRYGRRSIFGCGWIRTPEAQPPGHPVPSIFCFAITANYAYVILRTTQLLPRRRIGDLFYIGRLNTQYVGKGDSVLPSFLDRFRVRARSAAPNHPCYCYTSSTGL